MADFVISDVKKVCEVFDRCWTVSLRILTSLSIALV